MNDPAGANFSLNIQQVMVFDTLALGQHCDFEAIFELADAVTVLQDGRYVDARNMSVVTMDDLVMFMIGRELKNVNPKGTPKFLHRRHVGKVRSICCLAL